MYSCAVNEAELGVQWVQLLKLKYTFLLAPFGHWNSASTKQHVLRHQTMHPLWCRLSLNPVPPSVLHQEADPDGISEEKGPQCIVIRNFHPTSSCRRNKYLVSWIGYPTSENSWVDESDIHTPELLEEYRLSKAWTLWYIRLHYLHSNYVQMHTATTHLHS